jgi:osmotically-inducible protein OsmY
MNDANASTQSPTASEPSSKPTIPGSEPPSDTVISSSVKASLLGDPAMSGADVSVNTDHGIVSLTGKVRSQEQAAIASAHAQRPDGVMRIDSHLSVDAR